MKLLLEKDIVITSGSLNFKLMLDDEFSHGMRKAENTQTYILNISIEKGTKMKNIDIVRNVQNILSNYFINSSKYKKALYVPKEHEVSIYDQGYIDVLYQLKYKHPVLDNGYECDDEEIAKNLLSVHIDNPTKTNNVINIEFKSLFLVDELYNMQTLWEIDNGKVYDFLLDAISEIMCELEK